MPTLFKIYPALRRQFHHAALGSLPTPIDRAEALGQALGVESLYIKRDDQTGHIYGGNKVRKLEFLLARSIAQGARGVITFGAAGSNHALATSLYARGLGLRCAAMLVPQPNSRNVRRALLAHLAAGTELHACTSGKHAAWCAAQCFYHFAREDGHFPGMIPVGGSSPTGILGFVNAALELKRQIDAGAMPAPDRLYCASGTMGTAVGLLLGLRAAGLDTTLVAVRVTWERFTNSARGEKLFRQTNRLLLEADPAFPLYDFPAHRFELRDECFGEDYGLYTPESAAAVALARDTADLQLEGTYTGKALDCLARDARAGRLDGKTVLFWDTYNGADLAPLCAGRDYRDLPEGFHRYFEEDVQPLDRGATTART